MDQIDVGAGNEIIQGQPFPPFGEQLVAKMRPQKSCPTCHDRTHAPSAEKSIAQCNVSALEHPMAELLPSPLIRNPETFADLSTLAVHERARSTGRPGQATSAPPKHTTPTLST